MLGIQEVSFLLEGVGGFYVVFQGGGHLQVLHPLVAYELETVVGLVVFQIFVGSFNETVGQVILLLQSIVSQGCIGGVLGQIIGLFSTQGCIQVFTGSLHGSAYIFGRLPGLLHVFDDALEFRDIAGNFGRHVYQGVELGRTGVHHNVREHDGVLEVFVVEEQFVHVAKSVGGCFAGEAGRLGNIAFGFL